ncbi:MAG: sigma-70 family RNA polymerase sigma factor [Planctomycetes bacterium]|nr:sigma-70 family RNA polymerase sigma factor [Planctomycetota bacterium]
MSDERRLVELAKGGQVEAFSALVRLHQARLRGLAARYLPDADDVYDVVQDAFLDAFRGLAGFDEARDFGPWLRTICRNRVMGFLRTRATQRAHHLGLVDAALVRQAEADAASGEGDDAGDRIAALKHCLGSLQDAQRALVDLRYHQGMGVKDLSQRFGKSEAGMAMTLMRLREVLMRCVVARVAGR